jgi:hypothetical protein
MNFGLPHSEDSSMTNQPCEVRKTAVVAVFSFSAGVVRPADRDYAETTRWSGDDAGNMRKLGMHGLN